MSTNNYATFRFTDKSCLILRETRDYSRTLSGRSWKKRPDYTLREIISPKQYENYVTSIPFFNSWGNGAYCRAHSSYTSVGYTPTEINTCSPGRETLMRVSFQFIPLSWLTRNAGWREREIISHAKTWAIEGKRLTLYTDDDGVTASGTIDTTSRQWVA